MILNRPKQTEAPE